MSIGPFLDDVQTALNHEYLLEFRAVPGRRAGALRWPISSLWAVGMLVGIGMIMTGVTRLMMALAVSKTQPA